MSELDERFWEETHCPCFGAYSSTRVSWDGHNAPAPREKIFPILSVLVIDSLLKQFVNHDICGGGAWGIIYVTYSNFVIAIKCFLAPVDRCSMMTTVLTWNTNLEIPNVFFDKLIVNITEVVDIDNEIFRRLYDNL